MRFAWEKKKVTGYQSVKRRFSHPLNLVMMAYNLIWWIPIILPFTGVISYQAGFLAFLGVTVIRLIANLIRNNILTLEQSENYPFKSG